MEQPQDNNKLNENYSFDGTTYSYTDKETNVSYVWDLQKNEWVQKGSNSECEGIPLATSESDAKIKQKIKNIKKPKKNDDEEEEEEEEDSDKEETPTEEIKVNRQDMSRGHYGYEGNTHTYTDATDGTVYFWDKEKNAWFPKIDDTFIAYYQMSYGFNQSTNETTNNEKPSEPKSEVKSAPKPEDKSSAAEANASSKRKAPEPAQWFQLDEQHNTKVYVSNLPVDITEQEFVDLMQKCGLVMKDIDTGKMKIKLYSDPVSKELKGDALCTYIKKESVDLALNLLDGYDLRGNKIKVEKAHFTMKGNAYDPSLKPKKKRKKDKEKMKKMQERLFAWQPDKLRGERPKNERVVVIKNLFEPSMFDENLGLILEYQQDIREECSKCGAVKRVVIYDKHKDGIAQVWFKEAEAADACLQLLNNRWFGQRRITAETWDGKTKYKVQETPEEAEARLKKWEQFLNNKESDLKEKKPEDVDSDGTRSSADSGDETDEETKN